MKTSSLARFILGYCLVTVGVAGTCHGACDYPDSPAAASLISQGSAGAYDIHLVWTGSLYGAVWLESRPDPSGYDVVFGLLDRSGAVQRRTVVSNVGTASTPDLVWTGTQFGVVWGISDDVEGIRLAILDAAGVPQGPASIVADGPAAGPSIAWTGTEFAIAWELSSHEAPVSDIHFARFRTSGEREGPGVRVTDGVGEAFSASLVWTGTGFGLAWIDDADGRFNAYFARLDTSGGVVSGPVRISDSAESSEPALAWTGSELGLVWFEFGASIGIQFARLGPDGSLLGPHRLVAAADQSASIMWTGDEFAVTYTEIQDVFLVRLFRDGNPSGPPLRIDRAPSNVARPSVGWSGIDYLAAYEYGAPSTPYDIRARAVVCDCPDLDGDGYSRCVECDDTRPTTFPGRPEICGNLVDDDCDGTMDELAQRDLDGDGVDDACDVCPDSHDPSQADSDADGRGDACDVCTGRYDPAQDDVDGDGVGDLCDTCMRAKHPQATDRDADGTGDVCDRDDGNIFIMVLDSFIVTWDAELPYQAFNLYTGDLGVLRSTGIYTQPESDLSGQQCGAMTSGQPNVSGWAWNDPPLGQVLFYLVSGVRDGVEESLGSDSRGIERPNTNPCP